MGDRGRMREKYVKCVNIDSYVYTHTYVYILLFIFVYTYTHMYARAESQLKTLEIMK